MKSSEACGMILKGLSWKEWGKIAGKFPSFPDWRTGDCSCLSRLLLMNLLFITPIPLNGQSIIEFIK
jgi:hypothetical protein